MAIITMDENNLFLNSMLRGMLITPDDTSRLVMADWLEEQGDPRAAVLREAGESERQDVPLLMLYEHGLRTQFITYLSYVYIFYGNHTPYKNSQYRCSIIRNESLNWKHYLRNHSLGNWSLIRDISLWVQVAFTYSRQTADWPRTPEYNNTLKVRTYKA